MPYKNIIFTKLQCELATDERFTDKLDDDGKLIYFSLLLLMGVKENQIPNDEKWIKRTLNLRLDDQKIRQKLDEICNTFPKTVVANGYIKFRNYSKLHNYTGKSEGNPKNKLGIAQIQIQKQIIETYTEMKKYPLTLPDGSKDKELEQHIFKRNARAAKELVLISGGDFNKVKEAMEWFAGICEKRELSWSLETILKWYPDYLAKGKDESRIPEALRKFIRKDAK